MRTFSFWHCTQGIIGEHEDILMFEHWNRRGHYLIGTDHVLWKWEHYRPELQSQIGVRRGDHFIKVHMTFIASIKLNQDKSVHSQPTHKPSKPNIDKNHLIPAQPSLKLSRLDKINLDLTHSCNCCVVFSHLELSVINAFVMTRDLDTHKPLTTCTPHSSCMGVPTLTSKFLNGY